MTGTSKTDSIRMRLPWDREVLTFSSLRITLTLALPGTHPTFAEYSGPYAQHQVIDAVAPV